MKQLLIISCLILTTFTAMAAPAAAAADPKLWFREKYLEHYHDDYYDYYMSQNQYSASNNKRDICPEFHNPATLFAITGRHQPAPAARKSIQRTCPLTIYATSAKYTDYLPPEEYYPRFIRFAIEDVIEPLGNFMCDVFEVYMMLMSIILASLSSLFIIMLVFGQY